MFVLDHCQYLFNFPRTHFAALQTVIHILDFLQILWTFSFHYLAYKLEPS